LSRSATARSHAAPASRAGAHRHLRAAPPPRRVSVPARPARGPAVATGAPGSLLLGAAALARTLPDSRALDRLIRGRTWVAVIAVALIGIVAMQVHMLELNAGIGQAVEKTATLEEQNTSLRMDVSRLTSGERIAAEAQRLGLVMPNAGEVRYTDVHPTDAERAARTMRPADPDLAAQATAAVQAGVGTGASALAPKSAQTAPGEVPQPVVDPAAPAADGAAAPAAQSTQQTQAPPAATQTQTPATQTQTPDAQTQTPDAQTQAPSQQQAPVAPQQQQQTASQAVTPAGGAAATPGG
jgi:cell division protein FtsL